MATSPAHMAVFQRRPLTPGEIALGRSVFGEEIEWTRMRVAQAPPWLRFGAMVPIGRTIVFSRWRARHDFADALIEEQGWFVHELAHAWQAARGILLAGAKLGALGNKAYAYTSREGARLAHYNIERQAEIARHLMLARAGAPAKGAPAQEWLEQIWAAR